MFEFTTEQYVRKCEQLSQLCEPFFEATGIRNFYYVYFDTKRRVIPLSSNKEFINEYLTDRHHLRQYSFLNCKDIKAGYYNPDSIPMNDVKKDYDLAIKYSLYNCFMVVKSHKDYIEEFNFSFDHPDPMHENFYLNNIHLLEKFIENITPKIYGLTKDLLKLPVVFARSKHITNPEGYASVHAKGFFGDEDQESTAADTVKLTSLEKKILYHSLLGKSSKQIAKDLNLSGHTIKNYLEKIRQKYNCDSVKQLLSIFVNQSFLEELKPDKS